MDDFAKRRAADRTDLFAAVAQQRGLSPAVVEKDFWVCWTLRRLFTLPDLPAGLIFKGGTSLSKAFGVIERFSEDIDLSFDRHDLGFGGDADPLAAATRKKRAKGVKALTDTCRRMIHDRFVPQLAAVLAAALGRTPDETWSLSIADDDPDQQTLLFRYPASIEDTPLRQSAYIRPSLRLEFGARSDHWPAVDTSITPIVAEDFPSLFATATSPVHVLAAERTFWEKATAIHAWNHAPANKTLGERFSRHFYDVVRLYESEIGQAAIRRLDLLQKVAEHKMVFFSSSRAKYEDARNGQLRLVPSETRTRELERDYRNMHEMFFVEPPGFDHLIEMLREMETTINAASSAG